MSIEQRYKRDPNGQRLAMTGMNTVLPPDALGNKYPYLQNVRAYLQGRTKTRATQASPSITLGAAVHSLRRLNDTTPAGPVSGFALIGGASTSLYCNATVVGTGLSGNPLSLLPFRPNSSPEPWMYVFDSNMMLKVRADGLTYKMGIKEPQDSPDVGTETTTTHGNVTVLASSRPWSNVAGANPTFNYGDNGNGTGPTIVATPTAGATLTFTATGTAFINGASHTPGDAGPVGTSNPGQFVPGGASAILLGAWTNSSGVIVTGTGAGVVSVGVGTTLTVPTGATQFQLGIDGIGGNFSVNTGSFAVAFSLTTSAVATVVSLLGDVTTYYWGDSPHSGPVASYIWKNAGDTAGSGPVRDIGDASGNTTNNSLIFDSTPSSGANPMEWSTLDSTGAVVGTQPVFQPALESEGYQDFNMIVSANLFVPAAGAYTFSVTSKDNVMWGIGNNATWPGIGTIRGAASQTETVLNKSPLLPSPTINGSGAATSISVVVTFPGPGVYPFELDYDYWFHSGRTLVVQVNGVTIPPLAATVKQDVSYRYTYRSSITGATSNPSPASAAQQVPSISNTITPEFSTDPQVDKVDYYRMDTALDSFTYVGTGPNTNPPTPFSDQLLDADVVGNPLLQFDNFEPFPSIDLPRGGMVNVIGGVVEWVSGDLFNVRWLPGTIINIGGIDYALFNRPSSTTNLLAIDVADGLGQIYEISEPLLAAQPCPSAWGNTDNAAFVFAIDPLNPGDLLFCKGNNLDSAPDTNRQGVTSPSEPLVNGVMVNGVGMVLSAENGWMIYPNFTSALATVTGTQGNPFSLIRSGVTRGLYIRPCICADGSGSFFYRSKDGIEMSVGGGKQQSLTDADLYNLFPHEGFVPQPIGLAGFLIYPPDDTQPELQHLSYATGYLYYDYVNTVGTRQTIVLDVAGGGWVRDVYQSPVAIHALEEGPAVNGVLTGCTDGGIRALVDNGGEVAVCIVMTAANNSGDARANKTIGDVFVRASVDTSAVTATPYFNQYATQVTGHTPTTLAPGSGLQPYIIDFPDGFGRDLIDIEMQFQWAAGTDTYLDLWQPDWTDLPETTQDRPTDFTDMGSVGTNFIQGVTLEADTFGQPKSIAVQSDDGTLYVPDQNPVTFTGQSKQALTFTPPFVSHMVRIISTDGVPWRLWPTPEGAWTKQPYPEAVTEWQEEMTSYGTIGWQHVREFNIAHISTTDLTLTLVFDTGAVPQQIVLTVPNSGGLQAKTKIIPPPNKWKLMSRRLNSTAPFRLFAKDMEMKLGQWGRADNYRIIRGIGGDSAPGATL